MTARLPTIGRALLVAACALSAMGCQYVVLPPDDGTGGSGSSTGWTAVATSAGPDAAGDLAIALTIRNETGTWSAMQAVAGSPAVLTGADGKATLCPTVVVGTGGHRLAPGFQMRGFIGGTPTAPTPQLIRVACPGGTAGPGAKLALDYTYVIGDYNYYEPEATTTKARLEVALDPLAADLAYPVFAPVDGLVLPPDTTITAINEVALSLAGTERTADTLTSTWTTNNPGAYPSSVHIGTPPVIGSDGILYGQYEDPDLVSVPITPAGGTESWTTTIAVPADVTGLITLPSVESKKQRLYVHYAIDLGADSGPTS